MIEEKKARLAEVIEEFDDICNQIISSCDSFETLALTHKLLPMATEINTLSDEIEVIQAEKIGVEKPTKCLDSQLDEVYCAIDALMWNGCWDYLNNNLLDLTMKAWRVQVDILLAYATATFPAKSKLSARAPFLEKCRSLYPKEELWEGLD